MKKMLTLFTALAVVMSSFASVNITLPPKKAS